MIKKHERSNFMLYMYNNPITRHIIIRCKPKELSRKGKICYTAPKMEKEIIEYIHIDKFIQYGLIKKITIMLKNKNKYRTSIKGNAMRLITNITRLY